MAQAVAHLCKNTPITKVVAINQKFLQLELYLYYKYHNHYCSHDNGNARTFNLFPGTKGVFADIAFSKKYRSYYFMF